ncbi:MAG: ATP-binding protein [Planctomycetota bacterium]
MNAQSGPDQPVRLALSNRRAEIESLENTILEHVERHGYPKSSTFAIKLALEEALINAFQHGHRDLPDSATIEVRYEVSEAAVRIEIEDQGPGFDPSDLPDPTADENLLNTSGRGLMLMRAYMSRVTYVGRGNRVEMLYNRPEPEPEG